MMTYQYRYYSPEGEQQYGRWLGSMDWGPLLQVSGSNRKADLYQQEVVEAPERCFPLVTVRRKSTDPPWYNWKIRKRIEQKKGIY